MAHLIETPDNCSLIENGTTTLLVKNEFEWFENRYYGKNSHFMS